MEPGDMPSQPSPPSPPPSASQTSSNYHFKPGNKFGKGNPLSKRMMRLRMVFMDAVTELDVQLLKTSMMDAAASGDVAAARLVCEYALGKIKPTEEERDDDAEDQPRVIAPPEPLTGAG